MTEKRSIENPYSLWNPDTDLEMFLNLFGVGPTLITQGNGSYVFNHRGTSYINGNSSVWNVAIGLGREELVAAASQQMRELAFVGCCMQAHPKAIELASKLVSITSGNFSRVYLGSNGSEAVETALKIARQYHRQSPDSKECDRFKIISIRGSYHGFSYGALSTSGLESDAAKFGPLVPGFLQIEPPYCYRCPFGEKGYPECGLKCAKALEETIQAEDPKTVAAFILEPIMGYFGIVVPPEEYYQQVGEICRRYGLLFIADEIATGFGRTGKLFASEDWALQPDILCLGKALTSGYLPMSATLVSEAIYQRFQGAENYFAHGSTHSGHPVCAAVALANIDIIINEKLVEKAARVGTYLKSRLMELMDKHQIVGDVRGRGLMLAIELVKDRQTKTPLTEQETISIAIDIILQGIVMPFRNNILKFLPPLIIDETIVDIMVKILDRSLHLGGAAKIGRQVRFAKEFVLAKMGFIYQ
jgi:adenosylmethionine-8-amino-7-oxononanoate aminotransferase